MQKAHTGVVLTRFCVAPPPETDWSRDEDIRNMAHAGNCPNIDQGRSSRAISVAAFPAKFVAAAGNQAARDHPKDEALRCLRPFKGRESAGTNACSPPPAAFQLLFVTVVHLSGSLPTPPNSSDRVDPTRKLFSRPTKPKDYFVIACC